MRAFAAFIMSGRLPAALVAMGCGLLGLLLPPVGYLSGAAVALVTLRKGMQEGLLVMLGAILGTAVLALFALGDVAPSLGFALGLWLPVWLLALIWRATVSLPFTLLGAAGMGALLVFAVYLILPDPAAWWRGVLDAVRPAMEEAGMFADAAELERALDSMAGLMTGVVAATLVLSLMISLLISRWWQATLYNPGGFRREFHQLRLDRRIGLAVLGVGAISVMATGLGGAIATDLVMVGLIVYLFQGLALVHGLVALMHAHTAWLVALYLLLVFAPPQLVVLLSTLGFADTWLDFRGRWAQAAGK